MSGSHKTCILFAGSKDDFVAPDEALIAEAGLIVCADGGLELCHSAGMKADFAVGDFDSASAESIEKAKAQGTRITEYPKEKDETDLDIALKLIYRSGVRRCYVFGALGGRLDHELSNVMLMKRYAAMGMHITLKGLASSVEILTHEFPCRFEGRHACTLSILPLSDIIIGVRTKGMRYELHNEDMASGSSRGVSNVIVADIAEITCDSGEAAVITNAECGI